MFFYFIRLLTSKERVLLFLTGVVLLCLLSGVFASAAVSAASPPAAPVSGEAGASVSAQAESESEDQIDWKVFHSLSFPYNNHPGGRGSNVNGVLACRAVNGVILAPGEEFSYNETLGPRDEESRYVYGTTYSKGRVVHDIGGGICKISTMLYQLCLISGMDVTERSAHSMLVEYAPGGLDAAVAWGYKDFRFVNSRRAPVRIGASYDPYRRIFTVDFSLPADYTDEHSGLRYCPVSVQIGEYTYWSYLEIYDSHGVRVGILVLGKNSYLGTGQS
ncbi:VanW family protein [Lachnoclostridium sp. Marseille-P6806]|uniref:VanW family protein n=1 Tax=Lachnoclostridium sp. Marseille-P6806 TaxID=2364793 RepID=UPI00103228D0|nr:VanW family protein [Lachnoclostridium sp. Marseille-P6806]